MRLSHKRRDADNALSVDAVAGNGLLDRRRLLGGVFLAGAATTGSQFASAEPLKEDPWSLEPGAVIAPYETPSRFEGNIKRLLANPTAKPGVQGARTPHHRLNGTITPNGLHFVVSYGGPPDIDPDKHRLVIHGLVKRPLVFTLEALARYPMTSRITFLECGGNSAALFSPEPIQDSVQVLHGLASCAEWTGVKLSTLLEESGIDPSAKWFVAEGADAPHLTRSVPLKKAMDDAMVALYQNGERLMPANGYPMRLLLPGYEGNMNVKYLRRIKLTEEPAMSLLEAKQYTQILPSGKSFQFYFLQEIKSFITQPSFGLMLKEPGLYEISGIAYSGTGRISKVMVSADGGQSWAPATLQEPVLSKAFTRFRMPWRWDGSPAILQSRAWDEAGNVQPTRAQFVAQRGELKKVPPAAAVLNQHCNAITSWAVDSKGEVKHVYA
ncbi:MAG: sulfane dehydrogenase subunit SoxC [Acetobacteraceae bacterium]|nr:sulfane dehydrogenase subunit SoxC [Acetobacteraceae bacterium]